MCVAVGRAAAENRDQVVAKGARRVNSFRVLVSMLGVLGFRQSRRLSFYGRRLV
jgi:hypothetical protein